MAIFALASRAALGLYCLKCINLMSIAVRRWIWGAVKCADLLLYLDVLYLSPCKSSFEGGDVGNIDDFAFGRLRLWLHELRQDDCHASPPVGRHCGAETTLG